MGGEEGRDQFGTLYDRTNWRIQGLLQVTVSQTIRSNTMKALWHNTILRRFTAALLMIGILFVYALAQGTDPSTAAQSFPFLILIAYGLGMLAHWYKKY